MFNKYRAKGFTIREMVGLILMLTFFCFGFVKGAGLVSQLKGLWGGLLVLAVGCEETSNMKVGG